MPAFTVDLLFDLLPVCIADREFRLLFCEVVLTAGRPCCAERDVDVRAVALLCGETFLSSDTAVLLLLVLIAAVRA